MKNKIICIPFAYVKYMQSGENVFSTEDQRCWVYLKNACVALVSAKYYNEEADVVLATNLSEEQLPEEIRDVLKNTNIQIINIPYDEFKFPAEYTWSLAFYKLCVLKYFCEMGFEKIVYLDTDVYVQGNFEFIWKEIENKILLYDINHGLGVEDYRSFCNEVEQFLDVAGDIYITHYGGEFFASNYMNAVRFISCAEKVFDSMKQKKFQTCKGDEFIVSLVANSMLESVKNAGAYIYRFWTGTRFRLVSTCYEYNSVLILHLPAEKERGMLRLYSKYVKHGNIPEKNEYVWKICRLRHRTFLDYLGYLGSRLLTLNKG